jgi:hypothetical protein
LQINNTAILHTIGFEMDFDIDAEGIKLINTYMDWFGEVVPLDELEITSLEELKSLLRQAIVKNQPIGAS